MSSPLFDPTVMERYAEQLYRRADSVRIGSIVVGAALGIAFGAAPLSPVGEFLPVPSTFGVATILLGAVLGGFIGFAVGEGRSFRIRLQAQLVLFQLQLERNTAAAHAQPPVQAPVVGAQPQAEPVVPVLRAQPSPPAPPRLEVVAPLQPVEELAPSLLPPLSPSAS